MIPRTHRRAALLTIFAAFLLAACGSSAPPSPSAVGGAVLPPVEGFSYVPAGSAASAFIDQARATVDGVAEVEVLQAVVADREGEQVLAVAFSFPGSEDTESVDLMARVLDGLEDSFQAGSQRTDRGDAFVIRTDEQTLIMAPWGRSQAGDLVFLFALGPHDAAERLAFGILSPPES